MGNNNQKQKKDKKKIFGVLFGVIGLGTLIAGSTLMALSLTSKEYITIKFDANGGELSGDIETLIKNGATFKDINKPAFKTKPAGKEFAYWSYDKSGTQHVNDNDKITTAKSVYAQWSSNLTLTFKTNAEAGETIELIGPATISVTSIQKFGDINKPRAVKTKTDYKCYFEYWCTDPSKPTETKLTDDTTFDGNTDIYPVFKDEEVVTHHTMTFQACLADKAAGATVTFNGLTSFEISVSEKNTFGNTNKPTVTKTIDVGEGKDKLTYSFKKWVKLVEGIEYDVNDDEKFTSNSVISPIFEDEPQTFESKLYVKDNVKGVGAIINSSETQGSAIEILWQDGTTSSEPKDTFNLKIYFGSKVTNIEPNFLVGCKAFNQAIEIPSTVASIGNGFLAGAESFNNDGGALVIPGNVKYIGSDFLKGTKVFNQPITLSSGLLTIGEFFLANSEAFNNTITFPDTLLTIGNYFLSQAQKFNQSLTFPESLISLGSNFLEYDDELKNVTIDLSKTSLTTINSKFLYRSRYFAGEVKLPTTITTICDDFMAFLVFSNFAVNISELKDLESIGNRCFNNCQYFDKELDFSACTKLKTIGEWFLKTCVGFNSLIKFPESGSLKYIGQSFMSEAKTFNKPITIPAMDNGEAKVVGNNFMYFCKAMTSTITLKTRLSKFDNNGGTGQNSSTLIRNDEDATLKFSVKYEGIEDPKTTLESDLATYFTKARVVVVE